MKKSVLIAAVCVLGWFLISEIVTEVWYRYKESRVENTEPWRIAFPQNKELATQAGFSDYNTRELGDVEREILRFDDAISASWRDSAGNSWSGFLLEWQPDERLNQNDLSHNPTSCLPAAGMELVRNGPTVPLTIGNNDVAMRSWVFRAGGREIFVFMGSRKALDFDAMKLTANRSERNMEKIRKVGLGMRGNPLQTVQFFVSGPKSLDGAVELLDRQIAKMERAAAGGAGESLDTTL